MFNFRKLAWTVPAFFIATGASAQYEQGPNPTASALERTGPFSTRTSTVSSLSASGFGGGNLYYPSQSGSYGAIVLCPGFTAGASSIAWLGTRLASHGFVVLIIEANLRLDQPSSRASQLSAALRYLTTTSTVRNIIDPNRLAVGGHSMGGGGTARSRTQQPVAQGGSAAGSVEHEQELPHDHRSDADHRWLVRHGGA